MSGPRLTLEWIAKATGGELRAVDAGLEAKEVVTDSRAAGSGSAIPAARKRSRSASVSSESGAAASGKLPSPSPVKKR